MEITEPLRLAVGSHKPGSGAGCAMNVISWEQGDKEITDLPQCAATELARAVQFLNDSYCTHIERVTMDCTLPECPSCDFLERNHDDRNHKCDVSYLCAPCSVDVLATAHRTIGTRVDWVSLAEGKDTKTQVRDDLALRLNMDMKTVNDFNYSISDVISDKLAHGPYDPAAHLAYTNMAIDLWEKYFHLEPLEPPADEKVAEAYNKMVGASL